MLARSGVGKFLLVDDDVLFPGNLVRHDLDWREIATHKVDGVARKIQLVNPSATCDKRRHRLGGQEASGSIESLIEGLASCDLIVDCTADPAVFNYLCAAVGTRKIPVIKVCKTKLPLRTVLPLCITEGLCQGRYLCPIATHRGRIAFPT
jgi:tRNA A37 threonylcarbamoyladenosine dehydratase